LGVVRSFHRWARAAPRAAVAELGVVIRVLLLLWKRMALKWHFMRTELVTTLKRKATEIIADLESDQDPVLITQHGKPAAYLMAVEAFDSLNRRLGILEGIARGERAIEEGRVVTHAEAKKRMARWLR
jgi:prevent-host-death family protein